MRPVHLSKTCPHLSADMWSPAPVHLSAPPKGGGDRSGDMSAGSNSAASGGFESAANPTCAGPEHRGNTCRRVQLRRVAKRQSCVVTYGHAAHCCHIAPPIGATHGRKRRGNDNSQRIGNPDTFAPGIGQVSMPPGQPRRASMTAPSRRGRVAASPGHHARARSRRSSIGGRSIRTPPFHFVGGPRSESAAVRRPLGTPAELPPIGPAGRRRRAWFVRAAVGMGLFLSRRPTLGWSEPSPRSGGPSGPAMRHPR